MAPKKQQQEVVLTEGQQREVDECARLKQRAIDSGVRGVAARRGATPPPCICAAHMQARGYYTPVPTHLRRSSARRSCTRRSRWRSQEVGVHPRIPPPRMPVRGSPRARRAMRLKTIRASAESALAARRRSAGEGRRP